MASQKRPARRAFKTRDEFELVNGLSKNEMNEAKDSDDSEERNDLTSEDEYSQAPKSLRATPIPQPEICDCPVELHTKPRKITNGRRQSGKSRVRNDHGDHEPARMRDTQIKHCGRCKRTTAAPRGKKIAYRSRDGNLMYVPEELQNDQEPMLRASLSGQVEVSSHAGQHLASSRSGPLAVIPCSDRDDEDIGLAADSQHSKHDSPTNYARIADGLHDDSKAELQADVSDSLSGNDGMFTPAKVSANLRAPTPAQHQPESGSKIQTSTADNKSFSPSRAISEHQLPPAKRPRIEIDLTISDDNDDDLRVLSDTKLVSNAKPSMPRLGSAIGWACGLTTGSGTADIPGSSLSTSRNGTNLCQKVVKSPQEQLHDVREARMVAEVELLRFREARLQRSIDADDSEGIKKEKTCVRE